jgi:hypothetical protein
MALLVFVPTKKETPTKPALAEKERKEERKMQQSQLINGVEKGRESSQAIAEKAHIVTTRVCSREASAADLIRREEGEMKGKGRGRRTR